MIDSTPIVVIAGQVGAGLLGTDAFQEVDLVGVTQPITKWSYQIRRAEDVAWAVARAFYIARSGRPGPVVLDFAKNAQTEMTEYEPVDLDFIRSYDPDPETDPKMVAEAVRLINEAQKPLVLVGQGVELGNAQEELRAFVEKGDMPCGCTLLGLSALPSGHRLNKGMLGMHGNLGPNVKTNECDVLIAVGMRFDDRVTGKLETYARQAKVIHLDVDPSEIGKNVPADVPVLGNCKRTLALLTELVQPQKHTEWIESFKPYEEKEFEQVIRKEVFPAQGPVNMGEVVHAVSEATRNEAVLVTDVGQNQMMACHFGRHGHDGILPARRHRSLFRMPGTHRVRIHGRRGPADDHAGAGHRDGAAGSGEDDSAQQQLPGQRAPVAGHVLQPALFVHSDDESRLYAGGFCLRDTVAEGDRARRARRRHTGDDLRRRALPARGMCG